MVAESYLEVHRYGGAVLEHDQRDALKPCGLQPRDIGIVRDAWRYKFLTAPQLLELWWPDGTAWPGQRRLRKLFDAGHLERFRPIARTGSYPWTYHLGEAGHRLLQNTGDLPAEHRYKRRHIYEFGHVEHDLQLNAWVLAVRRAAGRHFLAWEGELDIDPPRDARQAQLRLGDDWSAKGLRDPHPRLLRPDAQLTLTYGTDSTSRAVLVEYDRTRRLDKNYAKFRRYDSFLTWWWHHTPYGNHATPPLVVFVCQDASQRQQFLTAADRELTGHRSHTGAAPEQHEHEYPGRRRILFALEHDAHNGALEAWQLPAFPPGHPARKDAVRRVRLASAPNGGNNAASGG